MTEQSTPSNGGDAMATDTTALQERIEGALREHAFVQHSPGAGEHIDLSPKAAEHFAARIAPLVAAEVRRYRKAHR